MKWLIAWVKQQVHLIGIAIRFYSRIPLGAHAKSILEITSSNHYFPLIGFAIAILVGLSIQGLSFLLPHGLAVILGVALSLLLTGAFHEDGLADFFDGMGGGYSKKDRLKIMRDSRLGTYGLVGLGIVMLIKVYAMLLMPVEELLILLPITYAFSRFSALTLAWKMSYVKSSTVDKGLTKGSVSGQTLKEKIATIFIGTLPLCAYAFLFGHPFLILPVIFTAMLLIYLMRIFFVRYLTQTIGGYNGDTLGAFQQLSEIALYLHYFAWMKVYLS